MGLIKVDPEKLRSTASAFQSTSGQVKQITGQMTQLVSGLSGQVWEGADATSFRNKFNGLNDDIQRMIKMIDEHASDLEQMAIEYAKTPPEITQEAGNLSSDVIV